MVVVRQRSLKGLVGTTTETTRPIGLIQSPEGFPPQTPHQNQGRQILRPQAPQGQCRHQTRQAPQAPDLFNPHPPQLDQTPSHPQYE